MTEAEATGGESPASSRRRARKKRRNETGFRSAAFGRNVFRTMAFLGLCVIALTTWNMRVASNMFGVLQVGMPSSEVRYLMGQASKELNGGRIWHYSRDEGANMVVKLDESGAVVSASCSTTSGGGFGCPSSGGIGLGSPEDRIINRLGQPDSFRYIPNGKVLHYNDLGLDFTLRLYRVEAIRKRAKSGRIDWLPRILWNLLP